MPAWHCSHFSCWLLMNSWYSLLLISLLLKSVLLWFSPGLCITTLTLLQHSHWHAVIFNYLFTQPSIYLIFFRYFVAKVEKKNYAAYAYCSSFTLQFTVIWLHPIFLLKFLLSRSACCLIWAMLDTVNPSSFQGTKNSADHSSCSSVLLCKIQYWYSIDLYHFDYTCC